MDNLFELAEVCLMVRDPAEKILLTRTAAAAWAAGGLAWEAACEAPRPVAVPGRPERPRLVSPLDVPKRKPGSVVGRAAQVHALAHIEFNAINLAWDAVYRFRDLPREYYDDWVQVALEEAHHYDLLVERLNQLGFGYGDFDAHNGLWEMARKTDHDPLERMAMVPRVLEARALEAVPNMMARLRRVEDHDTADRLEVIMRDEIGHVAAGSRWFKHECARRGVAYEPTYRELLARHRLEHIKGPLNREARRAAGFSDQELERLVAG